MPEPSAADDPMEALRATVRATQEAAERLARDGVPSAGWASARPQAEDGFAQEIESLAALARSLRDVLPDDLREQLSELVRQLLVVLRSLIDVVVARIESGPVERGDEPVVEDIPIA